VDRKFVNALSRGLEVLRCFGPRDRWLANQEIARRTGLAKPTVSRLAYTLTRLGHLRYSEVLNKYGLGSAAISLGFAALGQMDVRRAARPFMQALSDYTKASVHLAVNDRLSMQVVDTYWNSASFVIDIGSRVPVATTSLGRAWAAALPPAERTGLLAAMRAARPADWPTTRRRFAQALREHREHGFCLGLGDWRREINAVAAPLLLANGAGLVVVGCSGAAFQLDPERLKRDVGPRLLALLGNVRSALVRDGEGDGGWALPAEVTAPAGVEPARAVRRRGGRRPAGSAGP
jgi:DNA-binding IclR family transcriptional regulator